MLGWWMVHTIVLPVLTMLRTVLITIAAALASRPADDESALSRGVGTQEPQGHARCPSLAHLMHAACLFLMAKVWESGAFVHCTLREGRDNYAFWH